MVVRFTRPARKHRIGVASARHVLATTVGSLTTTHHGDVAVRWVGTDERGRELEIIALRQGAQLVVIHVMPTTYRKK